jgi:hypothetical protein
MIGNFMKYRLSILVTTFILFAVTPLSLHSMYQDLEDEATKEEVTPYEAFELEWYQKIWWLHDEVIPYTDTIPAFLKIIQQEFTRKKSVIDIKGDPESFICAFLNAQDYTSGNTALHIAYKTGKDEKFILGLIELGADSTIINHDKKKPFECKQTATLPDHQIYSVKDLKEITFQLLTDEEQTYSESKESLDSHKKNIKSL